MENALRGVCVSFSFMINFSVHLSSSGVLEWHLIKLHLINHSFKKARSLLNFLKSNLLTF